MGHAELASLPLGKQLATAVSLHLSRRAWGDSDAAVLAAVLPLCPNLVELSLGFNAIGDQGICAIVESCKRGALLKRSSNQQIK